MISCFFHSLPAMYCITGYFLYHNINQIPYQTQEELGTSPIPTVLQPTAHNSNVVKNPHLTKQRRHTHTPALDDRIHRQVINLIAEVLSSLSFSSLASCTSLLLLPTSLTRPPCTDVRSIWMADLFSLLHSELGSTKPTLCGCPSLRSPTIRAPLTLLIWDPKTQINST